MIRIYDNETGAPLGGLSEEQLEFLVVQLEEESETDQDYYITQGTIDMLEERGADKGLLHLLRKSLADREGFEIRWERR